MLGEVQGNLPRACPQAGLGRPRTPYHLRMPQLCDCPTGEVKGENGAAEDQMVARPERLGQILLRGASLGWAWPSPARRGSLGNLPRACPQAGLGKPRTPATLNGAHPNSFALGPSGYVQSPPPTGAPWPKSNQTRNPAKIESKSNQNPDRNPNRKSQESLIKS